MACGEMPAPATMAGTKKKSMNENYLKTPIDLLFDKDLNPTDKLVLQYLLWRQGENERCWPSERTIARELNLNHNTVQNSLARLAESKKISIEKPAKRGRGHSNRYSVIDLKNQSIEPDNCIKKPVSIDLKNQSVIDLKNSTENTPLKTNQENTPIHRIDPSEFMTYWNNESLLPEIKLFSESRRRTLNKRATEPVFAENWRLIIDKLRASAFHTGQNDRGWRASVDWLLKNDTNYLKILELGNEKNGKKLSADRRNYSEPAASKFGQSVRV